MHRGLADTKGTPMETETLTKATAPHTHLTRGLRPGTYVLTVRGRSVSMCRETLEAIVQAAYDHDGIVAMPSLDTEAARAVAL